MNDCAASEHERGFAQSRSSLTSTEQSIARILVELQHGQSAVETRLDAVEIGDEPAHRDKKHQRKMLNKRLSGAVAGKRSFAVLLGQNAGGLAALLLAAAAGLVQVH